MVPPTDLPATTLLLQEIQSVTSSMRRNQRWASGTSTSFATSQPPLPPYLDSAKMKRRGASAVRRGGRARSSLEGGGVDEGDLMGGFVELRRHLSDTRDITSLSPLLLMSPFLALVRSPLTSGPITSLALTSIHEIIVSILPLYLTPSSMTTVTTSTPLQISLAHTTSALSQCRFPSSSPQQDELVLLRLLRVIEALATNLPYPNSSNTGSMLDHMGDESVCELLEVGLGMLARARLSEGLRNTAQSCVQTLVRAVFLRLKSLRPEDVESLLKAGREAEEERDRVMKSSVSVGNTPNLSGEESAAVNGGGKKSTEVLLNEVDEKASVVSMDVKGSSTTEDSSPPPFTPYGLPTILELLRVLVALLNPSDQAHTDSMRLAALAILNTALEVGGSSLGTWPELREGVKDEGCRYLFQLTRSDSPALLSQSLRATSTLLATMLPHLKLQMELFLSYLIDRLTPSTPTPLPPHLLIPIGGNGTSRPASPAPPFGASSEHSVTLGTTDDNNFQRSTTPSIEPPTTGTTPKPISLLPPVPSETRELMLETLTQISMNPSFMVDLWINYDCSTESEDLFERMIAFLTRGVYPSGPPKQDGSTNFFDGLDTAQLQSLEILLGYVSAMTGRLENSPDGGKIQEWPLNAPSPTTLKERKDRKGVLLAGTVMFNQKPKTGLAFLEKEGIIVPDVSTVGDDNQKRAVGIAKFLRGSSRLDKKLVGEYISRPDQVDLLKAFIGLFDFRGKSIADAMRELLETFRLPGEAQPISRITETFAEHFFSFQPPEIATQDAVYVLAYSVIMLNTDLHNPQNRKRMTIEDYRRNLRGVNDGKDFDPEYLANIHDSLRKREIILPEEHVGQPGFDYAWKSLMQRARTAGPMITCNTSTFDESMFRLTWRPLISSIAYAFTTSAQDEHVIQKAITGFRQCATLAGHFHLPEVFDTIVLSLASATGLLEDAEDLHDKASYPSAEKDGQTLTVSPLSIRFGQSYRSQLATVVLFTIAKGNAGAIREGWHQLFEMFQTLFLHSLLPSPMLSMEDFLAGQTTIPMKSNVLTPAVDRRPEGGLLSTLSSYLLSPYGSTEDNRVMETSEEDVENTLVAVDCLGSCKLEELYAEILSLQVEALIPALKAIRALAESRSVALLSARSERTETGSPHRGRFEGQLPYDPACVFHLETMVSLASRNTPHIGETWPIIFEYLSTLLGSAQSYSVLLIERAVVGLLRLCLIVSETPSLRDQLYLALDVLRSLPSTVLNSVSEQLITGVAKILEKDSNVVRSQTEWGMIIALFRGTVAHPEASKVTLEIVQKMVAPPPGQLSSNEGFTEGGNRQSGESGGINLTSDNFGGLVALLDEFATSAGAAAAQRSQQGRKQASQAALGPAVERGLTALDSLYELRNVIPDLMISSGTPEKDAWYTFWLPPLLVISKQCVNGHREIRQRATYHLQRLLLSPPLLTGDISTLPIIFDRVLFPVMDELLKPQVYERDPQGMAHTRLKAATLLCKVFLQYVVRLAESEAVGGLFVRVLDKLERFMRGERDMLNEAGESLKNVILVMNSSRLLVPPPFGTVSAPGGTGDPRTPEQQNLWKQSADRIDRILPGFMNDNIPREGVPPTQGGRKSNDRKSVERGRASSEVKA